jgi:hypothetical protein
MSCDRIVPLSLALAPALLGGRAIIVACRRSATRTDAAYRLASNSRCAQVGQ